MKSDFERLQLEGRFAADATKQGKELFGLISSGSFFLSLMSGAKNKISMALNKPCCLLIAISGMERFAFKGIASNLVTYLTDVMKMRNSSAAKFVTSWIGFTSMLPLIVATVADSYWDRYSTIIVSAVLYAAGLVALTMTSRAVPSNKPPSISSLCWSLYLISLGQGGYNPSLQAFGADQLVDENHLPSTNKDETEPGSDKKRLFFQWWYFGICCGSLLGVSFMSYIQDTFGWGLGFAIPTLSMILSILMFLGGNRCYMPKKSSGVVEGKSFVDMVHAIKESWSKIVNEGYAKVELELPEKSPSSSDLGRETSNWVENQDDRLHPLLVAKTILRLLPIWVTLLMFAVIFQQPATFFTKQGMTMKRNIGSRFKIPPAALQSAITVSIIILMPLYDTLFIPLVRIFTRNEKGITVKQRMAVGMVFSVAAMAVAAVVERLRLQISRNTKESQVSLSIFWLLPQYILLGIADIFTVVGMQEFFYSEVPVTMRTMGIALYTSVFGVGSFVGALLITVLEWLTTSSGGKQGNWFADDMKEARLDKYYWVLAGASAGSLGSFLVFSRFLKNTRQGEREMET